MNIVFTVAQDVTADTLEAAIGEGKVRVYRERGNGTTRHIPLLVEGSAEREVAEWLREQREEGVTMKALAADLHESVPTLRRRLNALEITEEVEGYDEEDIALVLSEATVVAEAADAAASAPAAPEAPQALSAEPTAEQATEQASPEA